MLNLRKSVVEQFWNEKDSRMARIFKWMEAMEPWMLDENEDVLRALNDLMNKMEKAPPQRIVPHSDDLTDILAYISSARALRMLEWFDEKSSPQTSVVIDMVEKAAERPDNAKAMLLLDRLQTLKSLSLLGKIFSPNRTRMLADLLRQDAVGAAHA